MPRSAEEKRRLDELALQNFREYLRIPSVHPDVDYAPCVSFLERQAQSLDLPLRTYYPVPGKPIVVITWAGSEPTLPSVLLNSHMDVVPVFEESWSPHKPFSADIDEHGNIYARGTQDMKSVGIQYLEAVRRLKQNGVVLRRTVHLSFVPDEEIGGLDGVKKFIKTQDFRNLNVGVSLDEGMASPTPVFRIFSGERAIWHIHIHCHGQPGHGSLLLPNVAGDKVRYLIDKFMDLRKTEKKKLEDNPNLTVGDVTTVNLTQLRGGIQTNVIPEVLTVVFDIRLSVTVDHTEFEDMIKRWCREAGSDIDFEYEQKNPPVGVTPLNNTNPWWTAFKEATDELNLQLRQEIFPGGTDSRYLREIGIPAIGFSPINNTPVLLHDHNEYLNKDVFLRGVEIYETIIAAVANVEDATG